MWNKKDEFDEVEKYKRDQKRYDSEASNQRATSSDNRYNRPTSTNSDTRYEGAPPSNSNRSAYPNNRNRKSGNGFMKVLSFIVSAIVIFNLGRSTLDYVFNRVTRTNRVKKQLKKVPYNYKDSILNKGKSNKLDYDKLNYKRNSPNSYTDLGVDESNFSFFAQVKSDAATLTNTNDIKHKNKKFIQVNIARGFSINRFIYVNVEKISDIPKKGDIVKISGGVGDIISITEKKTLINFMSINAKSIEKQNKAKAFANSDKPFKNDDVSMDIIKSMKSQDVFKKPVNVIIFNLERHSNNTINIRDLFKVYQNGIELENNTFGPENKNIIGEDVLNQFQVHSLNEGVTAKFFKTVTLKNKKDPIMIVNYDDEFNVKYYKTFK